MERDRARSKAIRCLPRGVNQATTTLASPLILDVKSVHRFSNILSDPLLSHTLISLIPTSKKSLEMRQRALSQFSSPDQNEHDRRRVVLLYGVEVTQTCKHKEAGRQYGAVGPTEISKLKV